MANVRLKGMNRHQKKARRKGELRVNGETIRELVAMSESENPKDRLVAAENLCPCHVRRRIDEVWDALYRMLEDPDVVVRRAAYHTLEDGGRPDDPKLQAIFDRAWEHETDKRVRRFLNEFLEGRQERERVAFEVATISSYAERGKCDFCGETTMVKADYDTEIGDRPAQVCEGCDR